jgi:hypothetical protein
MSTRQLITGVFLAIFVVECPALMKMRKLVTAKQALSINRDFGLPRGVYIIKTSIVKSNQIFLYEAQNRVLSA